MIQQQYGAASLETAACLWEAVLELQNGGRGHKGLRHQVAAARERLGTSALRLTVLRWVDLVDAEWAKVKDTYDQPFDWEFVPDWIEQHIDWTTDHPTNKIGGAA